MGMKGATLSNLSSSVESSECWAQLSLIGIGRTDFAKCFDNVLVG